MAKIEAISKIYRVLTDKNQESDYHSDIWLHNLEWQTPERCFIFKDKMNRNISFCRIFASRTKKVQKTSAPAPASALPAFKEKKNLQGTLNQVSLALK